MKKILSFYSLAILLGFLVGVVGSLFRCFILYANDLLHFILQSLANPGFSRNLLSALFTAMLLLVAIWLVRAYAPEATGSGVPEIEGFLLHKRPIFWKRLLPVKFFASGIAIAANVLLGREGPTIQMGGNVGAMVSDWYRLSAKKQAVLVAAGAGAGLATAFNAPLAGVLFVLEEMHEGFRYSFTHFQVVAISCLVATMTLHAILGDSPAIVMPILQLSKQGSLFLFFILGLLCGLVGLLFNTYLMKGLYSLDKVSFPWMLVFILAVGAVIGYLSMVNSNLTGGGYDIIHHAVTAYTSGFTLLALLIGRFVLTLLSYITRAPGGIFAPVLAIGALVGLVFFHMVQGLYPHLTEAADVFAVAGMGALFASVVRAPFTGVVLIAEMTQNYALILPLMVSCFTAAVMMQVLDNKPLYTQMLERLLRTTKITSLR